MEKNTLRITPLCANYDAATVELRLYADIEHETDTEIGVIVADGRTSRLKMLIPMGESPGGVIDFSAHKGEEVHIFTSKPNSIGLVYNPHPFVIVHYHPTGFDKVWK